MAESHLLQDIQTGRLHKSVFMDPRLGSLLQREADTVAALYRAKVAKRTGRLAASTDAFVTVGGHKHDRLIGKVTVGAGVEYGVLHEFGAHNNLLHKAARDLAEIMQARTTKGA